MSEEDIFYTYTLAYPESMGGAVFYVGKGTKDRWLWHEVMAKRGGNSLKDCIIRSIWANGEQVVRTKIAAGNALQLEQQLIAHYGLENLTNQVADQGRSRQVTFSITPELLTWLVTQRRNERDSVSKVIFRLIENAHNEFLAKLKTDTETP